MKAITRFASVVGLVGVLAGAGAANATHDEATNAEAVIEQTAPTPTVPGGLNEAVGDVLGLGYEQITRLNGSRVEIADPVPLGGAVLRSFEAGASSTWPSETTGVARYPGELDLVNAGHAPSRISTAGGTIYVSRLNTVDGRAVGSSVRAYRAEDGLLINERRFPDKEAVTSLDAYLHHGREYVAIGMNQNGMRVANAATPSMPDHRWLDLESRDPVMVARLGADDGGRMLLVSSTLRQDGGLAVAWNVTSDEKLWTQRDGWAGPGHWAKVVDFGQFGPGNRQQVAIGWSKSGRTSLHDAATGRDWGSLQTGPADVVRFYSNTTGEHRITIRANHALIGGTDAQGHWVAVAEGPRAELPWLVQRH